MHIKHFCEHKILDPSGAFREGVLGVQTIESANAKANKWAKVTLPLILKG